jgi:hypothetical protein
MKNKYIWGAGYYGVLTVLKFEAEGIKINGFIDKNANSIEIKLGLPVIEPHKILSDKNRNFQIIIAVQSENAINEIKEQLKKAKLEDNDFELSPIIARNLSETEISNIKINGLQKIKEEKYARIKFLAKRSKSIHFMFNDKFANPTIEFINKNFLPNEHLFLVSKMVPENYTMQKFPIGENVVELKLDEFDYFLLNPKDLTDKKLIFHSLFNQNDVKFLYENQNLLKHSYWMVWGGDLYTPPTDEANNFVRQNIYGVGSFCDIDLVKQKYGTKHIFFDTNMAFAPIFNKQKFMELRNKKESNDIVIQINNSADDSTLEMLDILSKFKNENIYIRTILSYGKIEFNQAIINKGKEFFGNKFSYIDKMMPPDDYVEYLANNDILILYQKRQQGVGNLTSSLMLGKKVFVKSDVTTTQYLQKKGIKIFDSNKICDMNFCEFCEMPQETITDNIEKIDMLLSEEQMIKDLSQIFKEDYQALI